MRESQWIVLGTTGESTSYWQDGRILTRVSIAVEEVWVGELTDTTVDVVTLGGTIGEIGQRVDGALRFGTGQRVVLCLQRHAGVLRVVEMAQGAFILEEGANPRVFRKGFGMRLVDNSMGPPTARFPESLRDLELAVREIKRAP